MPREGVKIYDLLLSCPGDVIDLIDIVKECIEDFNRAHGRTNNVKIELKHWSTDAYPQSGGSAQELLNKQFINDCDACIALFGNRFGSPTDNFESGTEQEIEEMIAAGKQVFMYFIEREVNPKTIDLRQLDKVRNFKDKYSKESKGIYWGIENGNEFRRLLSNHLSLYFLQLIISPETSGEQKKTSKLEFFTSKVNNKSLVNCEFLYNKEAEIKKKIEEIQSIKILNEKIEEVSVINEETESIISKMPIDNLELDKFSRMFSYETTKASISEYVKEEIIKYCDKKKIDLEETFWDFGGLEKRKGNLIIFQDSYSLIGEENEKSKYEFIENLYYNIVEYNEYFNFFQNIDSYSYIDCYIRNAGTTFDEDIDIKIKIPKNCILKKSELPIPEQECIEEINKYNFVRNIFTRIKNPDIEQYSGYPNLARVPFVPMFGIYGESNSEKYKREKNEYVEEIDRIFCYDYYEDECNDILKFKVEYLKQNNSMYTPSIILFKKQPEYLEYEIKSKHYPDVIIGKIEV